MFGSRSFIIFWNCAMSSDCAPSLMAFSGAGCTSTINPSAPMATPARDNAGTKLRFPVAWLGSRTTGRCVNSFSAGIAAMSQVLRVTVSNVRMPRSHKITSAFPSAVIYSADISSSFTVLLNPRFVHSDFLAHEFVRNRNPDYVVHLRHGVDRFHARGYIPHPDHADYHAFLPFDGVHLVSEVLHLFSNLVNLFPCCMQFHGDDHFPGPLDLFFAPKTKSPLGWRVGRKLFSVDSLTETPHAAWMDSK